MPRLKDGASRMALAMSGCFLILFLISLSLFLMSHPWSRRVLFFQNLSGAKLQGEVRFLPSRSTAESNIRLLIEEMILGPAEPRLRRLIPRDTRILSLILDQREVYLDFSRELIISLREDRLDLDDMLLGIGDTVLFNFPGIRRIFVFAEGQPVGKTFLEGIRFSPRLLK